MNNAIVLSSLFPLARGMFRFGDADGRVGRLPAHRLRLGQVEQSVQYVVNGRHVLVLQLVGSPQVVARKVLAREPAIGCVLLLAGRVYPIYGLDQHLVLRLKVPQSVANLLRHAVVVGVRQLHKITCRQCFLCHNPMSF